MKAFEFAHVTHLTNALLYKHQTSYVAIKHFYLFLV